MASKTIAVTGQVLEKTYDEVRLWVDDLVIELDLSGESVPWIPTPVLPDWALLVGTVFTAEMDRSIETYDDLVNHPTPFSDFEPSPHSYLSLDELVRRLTAKMMSGG